MTSQLYLNGRFLSQSITGVQRFATEIVAAMDQLSLSGGMPSMEVLAPAGDPGRVEVPYSRFQTRRVGRLQGNAWEQMELPAHARNGILVNLGNTAPVFGRTQIVVIHDAGVFDTPETYSRQFRIWYKTLWRLLVRTRAHIVTVSEFSRSQIARRLGIERSRIHLMREGGDHMLRLPAATDILHRHGLQERKFALVVGSRVAHKNLGSLTELAMMLERRGMVLAIAGSIDTSVFRRDDSNFDASVRMLGRVTDAELRALYESAACLLFPTRYEGFGLPAVEAMTCDCPVLTSGAGAVREVCGDAALYFDTAQPASVIAVVEQLLDDPALAAALRQRGSARVQTFSWLNAARDLATIINTAANRESP